MRSTRGAVASEPASLGHFARESRREENYDRKGCGSGHGEGECCHTRRRDRADALSATRRIECHSSGSGASASGPPPSVGAAVPLDPSPAVKP